MLCFNTCHSAPMILILQLAIEFETRLIFWKLWKNIFVIDNRFGPFKGILHSAFNKKAHFILTKISFSWYSFRNTLISIFALNLRKIIDSFYSAHLKTDAIDKCSYLKNTRVWKLGVLSKKMQGVMLCRRGEGIKNLTDQVLYHWQKSFFLVKEKRSLGYWDRFQFLFVWYLLC